METCFCCDKPLDGTPNDGTFHDACRKIFDGRRSSGICVCCGTNECMQEQHACRGCQYVTKPFHGYP